MENHLTRKVGTRGNTKNWARVRGHNQLLCKANMELGIRTMSLSRDNTDSWVRISHMSNKFVMDLNNNDTEIPEDQLEDQALQLDAKDFACRSKA